MVNILINQQKLPTLWQKQVLKLTDSDFNQIISSSTQSASAQPNVASVKTFTEASYSELVIKTEPEVVIMGYAEFGDSLTMYNTMNFSKGLQIKIYSANARSKSNTRFSLEEN